MIQLVILGLLFLLPGSGSLPLIDRDEPRFAQATREMLQRQDWIVPYFNHEYRFDKPPLIYWMMAGVYEVGGVNELTARLPSVLCAVLLALSVYGVGRRWFPEGNTAFLAALILLTCFQMLQHGRAAVADMPMILCVFWSMAALYALLVVPGRPSARSFWILYGSLGLGFLAKGPVALAVPALGLVLFRLFDRRPLPWRNLRLLPGLAVVLAIVGAWGIPALIATRGEFYQIGIGKHVIERGHASFNGHMASIFFYVLTFPLSLFPWSAELGSGVSQAARTFRSDRLVKYLVAWLAGTYLLFSLYATKLPHYVMPAFPAWAFLLAAGMTAAAGPSRAARGWRFAVRGVFGILAILLVFGGTALFFFTAAPEVGLAGLAMAGLGLAVAGLLGLGAAAREARVAGLLGPVMLAGVGVWIAGQALHRAHPAIAAAAFLSDLPPDVSCGFTGYTEPSMVFYTDLRWESLREDAGGFVEGAEPRAVVIREREVKLDRAWKALFGEPLPAPAPAVSRDALEARGYETALVAGINPARTSYVRLLVGKKTGP